MKTAIVYATKYGCTKECAEILKTYLHGEVNILSAKADKINLSQYDAVFIGGSVYMGKIQKEITQFCKRNLKQLLHTKIGLFVCCYTPVSYTHLEPNEVEPIWAIRTTCSIGRHCVNKLFSCSYHVSHTFW